MGMESVGRARDVLMAEVAASRTPLTQVRLDYY